MFDAQSLSVALTEVPPLAFGQKPRKTDVLAAVTERRLLSMGIVGRFGSLPWMGRFCLRWCIRFPFMT